MKRKNNSTIYLLAFLLIVLTYIPYYSVGSFDFVNYDDNLYVTENLMVQKGISSESIKWAFTTFRTANWHPVTWLSLMTDYEFFGLNPGAFHRVNLLIHIMNSLLLFFLFWKYTGSIWKSWLLAILFAVHPVHVESVAWVSERKDVLSTLFWLIVMMFYYFYVKTRKQKWVVFALFSFVIGSLTKPMIVTLPFALLLIDIWPLKRLKWNMEPQSKKGSVNHTFEMKPFFSLIKEKFPFFIISTGSAVITFIAQKQGGAVSSIEGLPLAYRIKNSIFSYFQYIKKMIWPKDLAVFYPFNENITLSQVIFSVVILIAISYMAIYFIKKYAFLFSGWFWYLGTLVPVIGIVQVGAQSMADRYTYIPSIGLFYMIIWGVAHAVRKWKVVKTFVVVGVTVVIFLFIKISNAQVATWKDSITLFTHAIEVTDDNSVAYSNAGFELFQTGRIDESIEHLTKAVKLSSANSMAYNNLGMAYGQKGELDKAIPLLEKALELDKNNARAHQNMGIAVGRKGDIEKAKQHFKKAVEINPLFADAWNNLGKAYLMQQQAEEGEKVFRKLLALDPDYPGAKEKLNDAMKMKKK